MEIFTAYLDGYLNRNLDTVISFLSPACECQLYKSDDRKTPAMSPVIGRDQMLPGYISDFASAEEILVDVRRAPVEGTGDFTLTTGEVVKDPRVVNVVLFSRVHKQQVEIDYVIDRESKLMVLHVLYV